MCLYILLKRVKKYYTNKTSCWPQRHVYKPYVSGRRYLFDLLQLLQIIKRWSCLQFTFLHLKQQYFKYGRMYTYHFTIEISPHVPKKICLTIYRNSAYTSKQTLKTWQISFLLTIMSGTSRYSPFIFLKLGIVWNLFW